MSVSRNRRGGNLPPRADARGLAVLGTLPALHDCPDCSARLRPDGHGGALAHGDGCPTGAALDAMTEADRAWFAAHPDAAEYTRPLLPGDLGVGSLACVMAADGGALLVRVRQVAPGVRVRTLPANAAVTLGSEDGRRVAALLGLAPTIGGK